MASLRVEHFDPITDSTRIELSALTLLIGRQSVGKSSFMKLFCFCAWIEKKIMVSTEDVLTQYSLNERFVKKLKQFHRFNDEYFSEKTSIIYEGETICIH